MPQTRHSSVITFNFSPPALRWLLIIPALLAVTGAAFAVRWYVGNTVAEYTSTPDEDGIEMSRLAARWAPANALTHWRLGSLQERNFSASNLAAAISEYRLAVEVGPYDFRYWLELGRALEAAGDNDHAERALRRAVDLAPSYSQPHWQYGNLLVREGRIDEAFKHLSQAAESDSRMQAPVFALAAQVFGDDQAALAKALPSSALRLQLALSLIQAGKPEAAMAVANSVGAADRRSESVVTEDLIKAFIDGHHYHAALSLMRDSGADAASLPAPEQIWNGGFETSPGDETNIFHWAISSRSPAQIEIDNGHGHSGKASLRIVFKSTAKLDNIPISQTVIVQPDTQYKLEFYVRTEGLLSAATPLVTVKDLAGQLLASSLPVAGGTHDWQAVTLTFKSRPKEEGIQLSFGRESCDQKDPICPIFGTVWYDDFTLQRVGSAGAATARPTNSRQ